MTTSYKIDFENKVIFLLTGTLSDIDTIRRMLVTGGYKADEFKIVGVATVIPNREAGEFKNEVPVFTPPISIDSINEQTGQVTYSIKVDQQPS